MDRNKIIPYNPVLRQRACELRRKSTLGEILLWKQIRKRKLGVQFHRQVPLDEYIVDFYCHELMMAIEVDGSSHDSGLRQLKDLNKDIRLLQLGINVIRITDRDVKNKLDSVIRFLTHVVRKQMYQHSLQMMRDDQAGEFN